LTKAGKIWKGWPIREHGVANAALHQASFIIFTMRLIGNPNSKSPYLKGVLPREGDDDEAWHKECLHCGAIRRPMWRSWQCIGAPAQLTAKWSEKLSPVQAEDDDA